MITQELIDATSTKITDGFDSLKHEWITKIYTTVGAVQVPLLDELNQPILDEEGHPTFETQYHEVEKLEIVGYAAKQVETPTLPTFTVSNYTVNVGGQEVTPINGFYYIQSGLPVTVTTGAFLEGGEAITLPPPLALPVVMFDALNNPNIKRYASTTVENGVVTANVTFNESGAWKIQEDFVNESLSEVGQPWRVSMQTITLLVS